MPVFFQIRFSSFTLFSLISCQKPSKNPIFRERYRAHLKPYISANVTETDQVEIHLPSGKVKCIRPDCVYTSCWTLLCVQEAGSWSDLRYDAGDHSDRSGTDPRTGKRHTGTSAGHAGEFIRDHGLQNLVDDAG